MGIFNTVLPSAADGAGSGLFGGLLTISIGGVSLMTLLSALIVFVICFVAMRLITRLASRALAKSRLEGALRNFVLSCVKAALWLLTAVIVADKLGIPSASLVALVSVAGLALSLSLQDTLKNVFSGFTILFTRPFSSGDYVEIAGQSGTVQEINMTYTRLATFDNKLISIPNSAVVAAQIVNYSAADTRRVDIPVSASYDAPTQKVIDALVQAGTMDNVLLTPAPSACVSSYGDSAIAYTLRVWAKTEDYWDVYFALTQRVKDVFDEQGIAMTYPHLNVHLDK